MGAVPTSRLPLPALPSSAPVASPSPAVRSWKMESLTRAWGWESGDEDSIYQGGEGAIQDTGAKTKRLNHEDQDHQGSLNSGFVLPRRTYSNSWQNVLN